MSWEYAKMSKKVAGAGGPKEWVKKVRQKAYDKGYNQGVVDTKNKIAVSLFFIGAGVGSIIPKIVEFYRSERKNAESIKEEETKLSKELLLEEGEREI